MNPEALRNLMQAIQQARQQGRSVREINSDLRRNRNVPFNSVFQVEMTAQSAGLLTPQGDLRGTVEQEEEGDDSLGENIREGLASLTSGAGGSYGFGPAGSFTQDAIRILEDTRTPEVARGGQPFGALGGLLSLIDNRPVAAEGASERFRQDVEEARGEQPVTSRALEIGGLLGGVGGQLFRAGRGLTQLGGTAGQRIGRGLARKLGAGGFGEVSTGAIAQAAGTSAGAGLGGALEGGLIGFAGASGKPTDERLEAAQFPALASGVIASSLGGIGGGLAATRGIREFSEEGGEMLADAVTRAGNLSGTRRIERARQFLQQKASQAFQRAEQAGMGIPGAITDFAAENPTVRRVLRRSDSEASEELLERLNKLQSGEAAKPLSFKEVDMLRKELRPTGQGFARMRLGDDAPDVFEVEESRAAFEALESQLEQVPGFQRGMKLSASQNALRRADELGRKLRSAPSEKLDAALRGETVRFGDNTFSIDPNSYAEQLALREAVAEPLIQKLRSGVSGSEKFIKDLVTGSETQNQLRALLGSDEAFNRFMAQARRVEGVQQAQGLAENLVKAATFLAGQTSVFGTGILEVL